MTDTVKKTAWYRGQLVFAETDYVVLSDNDMPMYSIRYADGRNGEARCDEIQFVESPRIDPAIDPSAMITALQLDNIRLNQKLKDLYTALKVIKEERERLYQSNVNLRIKYGEIEV